MRASTRPEKNCIRKLHLLGGASCLSLFFAVAAPASAQDNNSNSSAPPETVVVTGTLVRGVSVEMLASPVVQLSSKDISNTGYTSVDGLLNLTTANIGSIGGAQDLSKGGADDHATRSANLRGLGPSATLVLLDGHRIASTEGDNNGNNYVSLDAIIPLIAVQRADTVLDGASATYGSDAIAGVINFIPKDEFNGFQTELQYTHIDKAPGYTAQAMVGGGDGKFHAMLAASYQHIGNLQGADRERTNFNNLSGASQPGDYILTSRPQTSVGGDVIINNGVNGPIDYSTLYANAGTSSVQIADPWCDVPGTGGIYAGAKPFPLGACYFSYQQSNPVIPKSDQILVYSHVNYNLDSNNSVFLEAQFYNQNATRYGVASFSLSSPLSVPASKSG